MKAGTPVLYAVHLPFTVVTTPFASHCSIMLPVPNPPILFGLLESQQ